MCHMRGRKGWAPGWVRTARITLSLAGVRQTYTTQARRRRCFSLCRKLAPPEPVHQAVGFTSLMLPTETHPQRNLKPRHLKRKPGLQYRRGERKRHRGGLGTARAHPAADLLLSERYTRIFPPCIADERSALDDNSDIRNMKNHPSTLQFHRMRCTKSRPGKRLGGEPP